MDVILYMLSFLEAGARFRASESAVCEFLYRMSLKKEFAKILGGLEFSKEAGMVYSDQILEYLVTLAVLNILPRVGSGQEREISELAVKKREEARKLFPKKDVKLLKKLAKIFADEMGVFLPPWHKNHKKGRK